MEVDDAEQTDAGRCPMIRTILVVAKAPIAGLAKTRLIGNLTAQEAAELAAAALLDTLHCSLAVSRARVVVAATGDFTLAARSSEVRWALRECTVIQQRGDSFAERLVAAHREAALPDSMLVQVGMDTPQLTPAHFERAFDLLADTDAVLGPASDGGWWGLGLKNPELASTLAVIEMSTERTGADTIAGLSDAGARVGLLETLVDVDTWDDARIVAAAAPTTRFARAVDTARRRPARGVA